jgi:hypothetical protein
MKQNVNNKKILEMMVKKILTVKIKHHIMHLLMPVLTGKKKVENGLRLNVMEQLLVFQETHQLI